MKLLRAALLAALSVLVAANAMSEGTVSQSGQNANPKNLQTQLVGGYGTADSTIQAPGVDPTLHAWYVTEQAKDRDNVKLFQNVLQGTNLAVGAADSTANPLDVHQYRLLKILLKITPRTGANTAGRAILQFRECMNSVQDSMSAFPEYPYIMSNAGVALSPFDTTSTGHLQTGSAILSWSGEYTFVFNGNRSAPGNGAAANVWSYPNGIGFMLRDARGIPLRFNSLSIRIRNASGSSPAFDYSVSLLGFSQ